MTSLRRTQLPARCIHWRAPKVRHRSTEYRKGFLGLLDYRSLAERAGNFVISGFVDPLSCSAFGGFVGQVRICCAGLAADMRCAKSGY
jgi:hypothetical protein